MAAPAPTPNKESMTETVLLRHPLPKYSFKGKKLPKESTPTTGHSAAVSPTTGAVGKGTNSPPHPSHPQETKVAVSAAIPASVTTQKTSGLMAAGLDKKSAAVRPLLTAAKSEPTLDHGVKVKAAVVAPNVRSGVVEKEKGETRRVGDSAVSKSLQMAPVTSSGEEKSKNEGLKISYLPAVPAVSSESVDVPVPDAALLAHAVEGPSLPEKLEKAEREIAMLRSQLDVQLQVNAEIKRLLVASVGEDFERKVETLARDRAQLAMEVGDFTRKMTEDYENLDQISIQADMWRSKYLASRVMVEELASARAFYSSQFQDSQHAVQQLLNERYELRTSLLHSYKILQQVKEAFDPLNSQRSHSLTSTSVLDLSSQIKQLSEAVRYRLLPAHAGSHVIMPLEESWESTMTKAELLAYDQLSKQSTPPSFRHSMPSGTAASTPATPKSFERFHPMARHDNLTVNCCAHCKGEIKLA